VPFTEIAATIGAEGNDSPAVITEQWWGESSYNMDFGVGQNFGEPRE